MAKYLDWGDVLARARQHPEGRIDGAHAGTLRAFVSRGWAHRHEGAHYLTQEGWAGQRPPGRTLTPVSEPSEPPLCEGGIPSRFSGTPQQWHQYLLTVCAEDTLLRFYQWVGNAGVREAVSDIRREQELFDTKARLTHGGVSKAQKFLAQVVSGAADFIDPDKQGGPYPSSVAIITNEDNGA
jgi:hypothetical protein